MDDIKIRFKRMMRDPLEYTGHVSRIHLRSYQKCVMSSVIDSVLSDLGFSFVVMFPRQSGKNEIQALIEAYLITLFSHRIFYMIKVSPTLNPQAYIGMRRFESMMRRNPFFKHLWKKEPGNCYRMGGARLIFLSAAPTSNIVGATASGLLEVDEAQQVNIDKFDRDVSPMAASTNATHVFWGTAWTSTTLLGRELRAAQAAERADGIRRVFRLTAEDVYPEVPDYRKYVEDKIARQGRSHPMIRTQYFSEEVDGTGGMFPPERLAKMRPSTRFVLNPAGMHALLLDVAGEDEGVRGLSGGITLANPSRDATALTLVEICAGSGSKDGRAGHGPVPTDLTMGLTLPNYRVVRRWQWIGVNHTELYARIREIALEWKARAVVVDATGVGAGLASFLDHALPGLVTPFQFNTASKSELGWSFLEVVDSSRWQEPLLEDLPGDEQLRFQNEFYKQLAACQFEVSSDSKRTMRWSVPESCRDTASGELLHDDWVLSAALCAVLEKMDWRMPARPFVVDAPDPLREMDKGF